MCKLQVTGQGTPKLVGVSHGPEGPRWQAGRVLGRLPASAGSLPRDSGPQPLRDLLQELGARGWSAA